MDPEILAYRCASCDRFLEPSEMRLVGRDRSEMRMCAACGGAVSVERSRVVRPIGILLAKALLYITRPTTLAISGAVFAASVVAGFVPFVGRFLSAGIHWGWVFAVLRSAAAGADDPEIEPTDIDSSIRSWTLPGFRYTGATLIAFGPAILALVLDAGGLVVGALGLVGALYLPSALIVAAHNSGSFAAMNPVPAVKLIARIPGPYATACALLVALGLVVGATSALARALAIPVVSWLAESAVFFFASVGGARMLGVLVHECREEL